MTTFNLLLPYDPSGVTNSLHDPVTDQIGDLAEVTPATITAEHPSYRKDLEPWVGSSGWLARCTNASSAAGRSKVSDLRMKAFHHPHLARAAVNRLVDLTDAPEVRQDLGMDTVVATTIVDLRSCTGSGEIYSRDQHGRVLLMEFLRDRPVGGWVLDGVAPVVVEALGAVLQETGLPRRRR